MQLQELNQRRQTQDMLSMFAQQSQQQNQTVLAILEKSRAFRDWDWSFIMGGKRGHFEYFVPV